METLLWYVLNTCDCSILINFCRASLSLNEKHLLTIFFHLIFPMCYPSAKIKLCSRDPSPPPFEYVKGGGGIFADMAVHDLDMSRFLAGSDPIDILAIGSCHIDKSIESLEGSEKFDTASCIVRYPNGVYHFLFHT